MPTIRIREAAELLGVSDDTVRRWIDDGALTAELDASGRKVLDGAALAAFARANASAAPKDPLVIGSSARNRFAGLVTDVIVDGVMAQVEIQCGPLTVVSLMSSQSVRELVLEPGSVAVAVVKATAVIVETPKGI
ncbi:TOBE domain-containing protein [Mycolicibacterium brisbanense]